MAGEPTFGLFTNGNKMMHREGAKSTVHFLCVLSLSGPHVLVQDPPLEQLLVHISHVLLHRFSDAHLPLLLYPAFKRLSPLFHSSWCPPGITLLVKLIKNNGFGSAFKLEERVICHKFSGEHALAQGPLGKVLSYLPQHWPTWFAPRLIEFEPRAVGPFPASFSLTHAGDVLLLPTSGHTPHHFSVLVQDGSISYFLAGDASYMERFYDRANC